MILYSQALASLDRRARAAGLAYRAAWVSLTAVLLCLVSGCAIIRFGELDPPAGEQFVIEVEVEGNDDVSDADLLEKLVAHTDNFSLGSKPLLEADTLAEDAARIERRYATLGYFEAQVVDTHVEPCGPGSVRVTFIVDEGMPSTVADVAVEGLDGAELTGQSTESQRLLEARDKVAARLSSQVGEVWSETRYLSDKLRLADAFLGMGFAHTVVFGRVVVDRDAHQVHVTYQVSHGPLTQVSEVRTVGAVSVDEARIQRRVDIAHGDLLLPDTLRTAESAVYDLGVFAFVRIDPVLAENDAPPPATFEEAEARTLEESVPIDVVVQEQPRIELNLGVGAAVDNRSSELHALTRYQHRNPFGDLRQFELEAKPGWIFLPGFFQPEVNGPGVSASASFSQPAFLEEYLYLSIRGTYDLVTEYGYQGHDVVVGPRLTRQFLGALSLYVGYRFEFHSLFNLSAGFNAPRAETLGFTFRESYLLSGLEQGLRLDLRDNPMDPRNGFLGTLDLVEANTVVGSDFTYIRANIDTRGFWSPTRWVTLALRARYGQVFNWTREAPLSVRQRGGGPSDMRGFGAGRMGPVLCLNSSGSSVSNDEIGCPGAASDQVFAGGDLAALGSFEARWRLPGDWGLVTFVDVGSVVDLASSFDFSQLEVAVGPGVRYFSPFGPIRADLAFLLTTPSPPILNFNFSIGQAF